MSIQTFLSKLSGREHAPTLARAEEAYGLGRQAEAAALFRAVSERDGSVEAELRLGQLYERGEGVLQSFVEAVGWFRRAAEQGAVPAMARLGEIYLTGMAAPDTATPAALLRHHRDAFDVEGRTQNVVGGKERGDAPVPSRFDRRGLWLPGPG